MSSYPQCEHCGYPAAILRDGFCLRCVFDLRPQNEFRSELREFTAPEILSALVDLRAAADRVGERALSALIAAIVDVHVDGDGERLAVALGRLRVPPEQRLALGSPALAELHPALRNQWAGLRGRPS